MRYFKVTEFASPDEPGSGFNMDKDFVCLLDKARELAGVPFRITSGYRSEKHNKKVGGVKHSSHLRGLAVDIYTPDSNTRFLILDSLFRVGLTRFGLGENFIHVDADELKPSNVVWTYY